MHCGARIKSYMQSESSGELLKIEQQPRLSSVVCYFDFLMEKECLTNESNVVENMATKLCTLKNKIWLEAGKQFHIEKENKTLQQDMYGNKDFM